MGNMKDSGIEWIGLIPEEWDIYHFKYIVNEKIDNRGRTPEIDLNDIGTAVIELDAIGDKNPDAKKASKFISDESYRKYIRKDLQTGDVLFGTVGSIGKCSIVPEEFNYCIAQNIVGYRFKENQNSLYWFYYFKSEAFKQMYMQFNKGNIQDSVKISDMERGDLVVPSLSEQQLIAEFLDDKVGKINDILSDLRKQVEILLNYRKAIITNSVTKGIRNNECIVYNQNMIGKYANHYKIKKFKYIADVKSNLVDVEKYKEYIQISPENIEKDTGRLLECGTVEEAGVISDNHLFFKGQIVYSKIRPNLNKVIIAPFDGLCSADMYPIETQQNIEFLKYLMLSTYFVEQVSAVTRDRVKMPKINQDELGNIVVVIPPLEEQQEIVDYLDDKCAKIDELIKDKEAQIEKMEKYKKSLIYEYVTGKKRVKGAV